MANYHDLLEFAKIMYTSSSETRNHGCLPPWIGRCLKGSVGGLEHARVLLISKLPRHNGNFLAMILFRAILKKNKSVRQHHVDRKGGLCQKISQIAKSIWTEVFDNGMSIQCAHILGCTNLLKNNQLRMRVTFFWYQK